MASSIFWSNGLVATLCALGVVLMLWPVFARLLRRVYPRRRPVDTLEE